MRLNRKYINMDIMFFMEQMGTSNMPLVAAFFIGLMTAISPCPLATNITAIAYTSQKIGNNKQTLLVGILYTLGRIFTYTLLASLIVYAGLNTQQISLPLQKYGEKFLGPLMIFIGLVMLEILNLNFLHLDENKKISDFKMKLTEKGYLGAFFLGVIFALAFCPFSAVLFFGMLIPLALKSGDGFLIPLVFAFATGLPVILAAILLTKSVSLLGKVVHKIRLFEKAMRKFVGIVFLCVGVYYVFLLF